MGDTIYVPSNGKWVDSPMIDLRDLFPGKTVPETDEIMSNFALSMEEFLERHGQTGIGIRWINRLERDENPDGTMGYFRFYPKLPRK